jgi:hypothetical protein
VDGGLMVNKKKKKNVIRLRKPLSKTFTPDAKNRESAVQTACINVENSLKHTSEIKIRKPENS